MTSKSLPLVTIAIPTYNRADGYLKHALRSAVSQTYPNVEIIVSDNCSTDNTEEVVKAFNDSRIRYFKHKENIGANNNFNFCLNQAKGEYFLLLHDDDLIDDDFVETCVREASYSTNAGIIRTGTRVIDSTGKVVSESLNKVKRLSLEDFFLGWFNYNTSWYLCSTLFNTKGLKEIGGFWSKNNLVEDGVAIVILASRYGRTDVEDIKASFRKHFAQITFAVKIEEWCDDYLFLLDKMCDLAQEKRNIIYENGLRFFANINYNRARAISSSMHRLLAYLIVYKKFNYKYLPPPINSFLYNNKFSILLRILKRNIISKK